MRLALLSDQHGSLPAIPECDILVLAGDLCGGPEYIEGKWRPDISDPFWLAWLASSFAEWTKAAPHTIAIGGNHDTAIEYYGLNLPSVVYLHNSGCEIAGLKFWGAGWIKRFDSLAFNKNDAALVADYAMIPNYTDVLVVHGPPYGYGDYYREHCGSKSLLSAIDRVQPKLVVCGHIHEARGEYWRNNTRIINTATAFTEIVI